MCCCTPPFLSGYTVLQSFPPYIFASLRAHPLPTPLPPPPFFFVFFFFFSSLDILFCIYACVAESLHGSPGMHVFATLSHASMCHRCQCVNSVPLQPACHSVPLQACIFLCQPVAVGPFLTLCRRGYRGCATAQSLLPEPSCDRCSHTAAQWRPFQACPRDPGLWSSLCSCPPDLRDTHIRTHTHRHTHTDTHTHTHTHTQTHTHTHTHTHTGKQFVMRKVAT